MAAYILVAEDDHDILSLVRAVLEESGYEVGTAVGAQTLQSIRTRRPDLVLLDYQMPGMDGVTIAQSLRTDSATRDIPIIAMTAAGRTALVCRQMEADGCLGKPFDIDDLVTTVTQLGHNSH